MNSAFFKENISTHFIDQVKEYAIFAIDVNGIVATWNIGAERIKGYKEDEIVGKYYGILFTEEDQQKGKPQEELEITKQKGKFEAEGWRRKKDGSWFWAGVSLNAVYNDKKELIGFTKVTRDLTEKKRKEDQLFNKNEELSNENNELSNENDELSNENDELTKTNEDLDKINKDLDNFIYTASHDLKAPILNIEGLVKRLVQLFEKKSIDSPEFKVLVSYMEASINRFKVTIEDLTTISRLQRSISQESNEEWVDVRVVHEDVMADISFLFEQFPCQLKTDFQVTELAFSRKNFRSILYNLVSNAFKYRSYHRNCEIEVQTLREKDWIVLKVKDNGLGISTRNQEKLFTMFKRFHTHTDGSGIGLYIIKRIIDNAGGFIEVDSTEGQGTEFRVYFKP